MRDFAFDFYAFMVYTLSMDYSTEYQKMAQASDVMQETKDCAVISIAIVAGLTYVAAHNLFEQEGRKPRATTLSHQVDQVLKRLNIDTEDVTKQWRAQGAKTIRTLGRVAANHKGTYLAFTRDHIMAIKDGAIHDWLTGHLHRITQVVKLKGTTR